MGRMPELEVPVLPRLDLIAMPLEEAPADLEHQRARGLLALLGLTRQQAHHRVLVHEVARDHREDEPAVVADIPPRLERVEQVGHHRRIAQLRAPAVLGPPLLLLLSHVTPPGDSYIRSMQGPCRQAGSSSRNSVTPISPSTSRTNGGMARRRWSRIRRGRVI